MAKKPVKKIKAKKSSKKKLFDAAPQAPKFNTTPAEFQPVNDVLIYGIARVCHEVNRGYCESIGDDTQLKWEEAPDWQKESAIAGVKMHIANPNATPEDSHNSWLKQKQDDGWSYGPVKDVEKKQHPCFRSYSLLPQDQKVKDFLFRAVVHALWG